MISPSALHANSAQSPRICCDSSSGPGERGAVEHFPLMQAAMRHGSRGGAHASTPLHVVDASAALLGVEETWTLQLVGARARPNMNVARKEDLPRNLVTVRVAIAPKALRCRLPRRHPV